MQKFVYYAPTEIVFGRGTELRAAELVKKHGGSRVLVVYGGQSAKKSGLIGRVTKNLEENGIPALALGGVVPNPLVSTAAAMAKEGREFGADFVLAVGGGSVIDTAKGVAHTIASPEHEVWDFWSGTKVTKSLPIGAILTISAAGSETSNSAVLTNDLIEPHTKRGINTDFNRCRFAIMNPELTMTLPKYQIGAGAADIFMHTSERYFAAVLGNHLTDEIAEGLFRDIIFYGPRGVQDPSDYEAMSEIMWCGSVSHVGLTGIGSQGDTPRDGDWACHQLGMAISALYDSTHGATLTAVWAAWSRYVKECNVARFAQFARKVYGIAEPDDGKAAEEGIRRTNEFFRSLGMPLSLTELLGHEPTDEEIEAIAEECTYGRKRSIGSFRVLGYDDIVAIYKACR
ncbi:MAG: iron-containing alcohol dehydrogenase [Lachnospiraceae bacterium]|nr:iron-containing alcohol dehydrogenase [Lachnospiraceae bacterium]